jgi:hypothetical protein
MYFLLAVTVTISQSIIGSGYASFKTQHFPTTFSSVSECRAYAAPVMRVARDLTKFYCISTETGGPVETADEVSKQTALEHPLRPCRRPDPPPWCSNDK